MGAALYVVVDIDEPDFDTEMDGTALSTAAEAIAEVAADQGLQEPFSFVSVAPEELEGLVEELDEDFELPEESWWTAKEGLAWLTQLRATLEANAEKIPEWVRVQADLERLAEILGRAEVAGARWHLAVDY